MVYDETGEILLSLRVKCRIVKYWNRLITYQTWKLSTTLRGYFLLAPAVTVGETEGAMDSASVFLPLLLPITLKENKLG